MPARPTVTEERVVIEAEDHEAAYPLTIDPLFTLQQRLTAADGMAQDLLGYAVALDGDTALVGAYLGDAPPPTRARPTPSCCATAGTSNSRS